MYSAGTNFETLRCSRAGRQEDRRQRHNGQWKSFHFEILESDVENCKPKLFQSFRTATGFLFRQAGGSDLEPAVRLPGLRQARRGYQAGFNLSGKPTGLVTEILCLLRLGLSWPRK